LEIARAVERHIGTIRREFDLVSFRILEESQLSLRDCEIVLGDVCTSTESLDDLVANHLVELVAANLRRAPVSQLAYLSVVYPAES
jgi:hypothetical protein